MSNLHDNIARGLDGRAIDKNKEIRLKNGAAKVKNLLVEFPEYRAFNKEATLTGLRRRYGVRSEEQLRRVAAIKLRAKRSGA